jgi:hypothetical protein
MKTWIVLLFPLESLFSAKAWGTIHRTIALLAISLCVLSAGSQKAAAQAPVLTSATSASSTSVTLTWTESDPQNGWFRVFYGTSSGHYTASVDVANSPSTVNGLTTGTTYYFAVQFHESGTGIVYGLSNELSCTVGGGGQAASTDVLTYHNNNARTGWNPNEVILTPANVNPNTFGLLFNLMVDGKVDAQPLYVSNAPVFSGGISKGNHNLVIVATEHDSLYAFDADTGVLYWQSVLLGSGETTSEPRFGCDQVTPEIGITATPVIDRNKGAHGTIYVVAMSKASTVYHQRLWGIDLGTGQNISGSPVDIQASYPGTGPNNDGQGHVLFAPGSYKERSGLLLLNGIIYTTWASHCDIAPYTSWVIAYDETSLQQVRVLNLDPNGGVPSPFLPDGSGNAFWNSGAGPAADANGFIYDLTANGPFETTLTASGFPNKGDYGDTFLKLSTGGPLSVNDYFTPFDEFSAASNDTDLGSGGVMVLPDMVDKNGVTRHLAIGAGKDTNIYLVDRDNMGKFNSGNNSKIYQELAGALPGGEWATAAYFNGVYYGPVAGALRKFTFTQARLNSIPAAMTSTVFSYPGVTPSVSSSGTNAGIVWAYENPNGGGSAVLHAYKASDLTELYNSNQSPGRDQFGIANKFITPTVCNGKVLVGTTNSVGVFGLLSAGGGGGNIAFVQGNNAFTGGSASSLTAAYSNAQTAGNTNIVVVCAANNANWTAPPISSVSDNINGTYTLVGQVGGNDVSAYIYRFSSIKSASAGANKVTVTMTAPVIGLGISTFEYSGLVTSSPLDGIVQNSARYSANASITAVSTTNAKDLVFAVAVGDSNQQFTAGTGYTLRAAIGTWPCVGIEDQITSSAGSYSASFTNAVQNWAGLSAAIK